jgi:CRP-like cAMP-binding protein
MKGISRFAVAWPVARERKMKPNDRSVTKIFGRLAQQNKAVGESFTVRSFAAGGRVQLYRVTPDGRRFVIATLGSGSLFGEDSLLGGDAPDTYAVALERCTIWTMPRQEALELSSREAMFGFGLIQAMGQRLVEAENRLEQMAYSTISARLAALLLELGDSNDERIVHATHQELADMLGTWRETISKTLQDFRRRGLVASGRRQLTLLDREGLALEAGGL